jgi:hypothetical protein
MARIRTIKPEFWTSLTIASLPVPVRLTFIGLWNHCDDHGRALLEPRLLKAAIWPLDDDVTSKVVELHIRTLAAVGLVHLYEAEGRNYLAVSHWTEHQKVEKRKQSRLPPPPQPVPDSSPTPPRHGGDSYPLEQGTGNREQGTGNEGDGAGTAAGGVGDSSSSAGGLRAKVRNELPEDYRAAFDGHLRASRNPEALVAELQAIATGMHPPGYPWAIIGRAMHELAVAGAPLTARSLRGFCRKLAEPDPPPRASGKAAPEPEDEFAAAARRLEEEERRKGAARV